MRNIYMKKSKKGITLVESVLAVVILAILTIGVLTLLTAGGYKIAMISKESSTHAEAVQKLDLVISAISNGSDEYIIKDAAGNATLDISALNTTLGFDSGTQTITSSADTFSDGTNQYLRGWYLTLSMSYTDPQADNKVVTVTVNGYASNTEGAFDRVA